MSRVLSLFLIAVAACGGGGDFGGEGQPCGPNGECDPGLECDLASNTCVRRGASADAGTDARLVDAAPPDVPPGTLQTDLLTTPPDVSNSASAMFTFSATLPGATFTCSVDGGAFAPCTSPATFSNLTEGTHTFAVKAKVGSIEDSSPASFTWRVDTTKPVVQISSPSAGGAACTQATVTFDTNPSNDTVTYTCALDGGTGGPCLEPSVTFALGGGSHTVRVTATDEAGNSGFQEVTFNVDVTGPTVTPGAVTPGAPRSGAATVAFTTSEAGTVQGGVAFDNPAMPAMPYLLPACTCAAASCSCTALAPGTTRIALQAVDACGNVGPLAFASASVTFGPDDGHAVLIGDDAGNGVVPDQLLVNAVTLAAVRHRAVSNRPLRVLGWRGGIPAGDAAKTMALAALTSGVTGFDTADPERYFEFTDDTQLANLLRGRDVLLVFDQKSYMDATMGNAIADRWHAALSSFVAAGGVVVVLSGTFVDPGTLLVPSETWRVIGGSNPLLALDPQVPPTNAFDAGVDQPNGIFPRYPATLLGTADYWLAKGVGPFGTSGSQACFTLAAGDTATALFDSVMNSCGDGCFSYSCPVVFDKVFPVYAFSADVPQLPGNTQPHVTGLTTQGTYSVAGGVSTSARACDYRGMAGYQTDPTAAQTCASVGSGTFTITADTQLSYRHNFTAAITLLDAGGEPQRTAEVDFHVDDVIFVSAFPTQPVNTLMPSFYVAEYAPDPPFFYGPPYYLPYASSSCYLQWRPTPGQGGFTQVGPTRTNNCGDVAAPLGGFESGTDRLIDWTATIRATGPGEYLATLFCSDFYGNMSSYSTSWVFN